jgi:diacylglycerol kinase family enzyme
MILGMGSDAEVIRRFRTGRFGRAGWPAYALSALRVSRDLNSYVLSGNINGGFFHTNAIFFGTALGCCFGKRIIVAPPASPVRNQFELVWAEPVGFFGRLLLLFFAYLGTHYRLPWVRSAHASRVSLDSVPQALIQADGELIGNTPVEIEIIPEAFSFAAKAMRKTSNTSVL